MKKLYIEPTVIVLNINIETVLTTISSGEDWNSGEGASRETSDWED